MVMWLLFLAALMAPQVRAQVTQPAGSAGIAQSPARTNSGAAKRGPYDESVANPYPLPDPLRLKNGQPVKDATVWWQQRRPEILEDFRSQIYGRIPGNTPK